MARFRSLPLACFVSTFSLIVGCLGGGGQGRPDIAPVSGKVTYNDQAVDGAVVRFTKEGANRVASGTTDAQGEFKLTTYDTGDGAIVGEHRVTISKFALKSSASSPTNMNAEDYGKLMTSGEGIPTVETTATIPAKYANPEQSGLTRTVVKDEANVFNFDL